MALQIKRFPQILNDAIAWMLAAQTKVNSNLTDFNDGSMIRSFLEAVSNEIEQAYLTGRVGFESELPVVAQTAFNFMPLQGSYASGFVVFSCVAAAPTAVLIQTGSIVSTAAGLRYQTMADGTIPQGNTSSGIIPVQAMDKGMIYNAPTGSVTIITTPIIGAQSVTNAASMGGGTDVESIAAYLTRFQVYVNGLTRCSPSGLESAARAVVAPDGSTAQQVSIVENIPPVAVSSYTGGIASPGATYANVAVYVDNGSGTTSTSLLQAVGVAIWGDGTTGNPGVKAAGIGVYVLSSTPNVLDVVMTIRRDNRVNDAVLVTTVTLAIQNLINSLNVGQTLYINDVIEVVMATPGVLDITSWTLDGTTPVNITPSAGSVNRAGVITVAVTS
jgi:uncharacterized phage protein gp47/JayE